MFRMVPLMANESARMEAVLQLMDLVDGSDHSLQLIVDASTAVTVNGTQYCT
jgi:hypothetical protein